MGIVMERYDRAQFVLAYFPMLWLCSVREVNTDVPMRPWGGGGCLLCLNSDVIPGTSITRLIYCAVMTVDGVCHTRWLVKT